VPAFGDAELTIAGRRLSSPIGVNGEFFLDDLGAGWQRMVVRYEGVRHGCESKCRIFRARPGKRSMWGR
jgi:hypothetical protein